MQAKLSKSDIKQNLTRRLSLIKEISEIRSKVKDYYNQAISLSIEFRNSIISLRNSIKIENDELINIPDFQPLLELNSQFSRILRESFDDNFISMLSNIENSESSTENSFMSFFDTILSNKTSVKELFPSFIVKVSNSTLVN